MSSMQENYTTWRVKKDNLTPPVTHYWGFFQQNPVPKWTLWIIAVTFKATVGGEITEMCDSDSVQPMQ